MQVIDNFLYEPDFLSLQDALIDDGSFPWYFRNSKVSSALDDKHNFQFVHSFYKEYKPQSQYIDILAPFFKRVKPLAILRIKANLTVATPEINNYGFHIDGDSGNIPSKTAVYYVNSNNGYTVFDNGEKVNSVANRMVVFDSKRIHAGTSCTDAKIRCVINFNYIQ